MRQEDLPHHRLRRPRLLRGADRPHLDIGRPHNVKLSYQVANPQGGCVTPGLHFELQFIPVRPGSPENARRV